MKRVHYNEPEELKNDPIIRDWEINYYNNFKNGNFSLARTKPFSYLQRTYAYRGKPHILVAAGPSLDKNIAYLKTVADRAVIYCADVCTFRLVNEGIIPDFVFTIDPSPVISRSWRKIDTTNMILVTPTTSYCGTADLWKGFIFYFNQKDFRGTSKGDALHKIIKNTEGWGTFQNKFFVGATMLQIASVFSPSTVILMGYDFSFTEEKIYCSGLPDELLLNQPGTPEFESELAAYKANFKKELEFEYDHTKYYTNQLLDFYKRQFEILRVNAGIPVINSTEGGILRSGLCMPLEKSTELYCIETITKVDAFNNIPSRRRKKR